VNLRGHVLAQGPVLDWQEIIRRFLTGDEGDRLRFRPIGAAENGASR
jgi:hypothetical protein